MLKNSIKDMGQAECISQFSCVLHEEHAVPLRRKRYNLLQLFSVVRLVQCEKERSATAKRVFSSEGLNLGIVVNVEGDHLHSLLDVCRQEYQFCLGKASLEGRMTGATDGSMPVGSGRFLSARFPASPIQ
jgi:hypothetical protein